MPESAEVMEERNAWFRAITGDNTIATREHSIAKALETIRGKRRNRLIRAWHAFWGMW